MDTDNPRPGAEPSVETGVDWRTQLPPDSRQRILNKITETLKKHLPFSGQEGLEDLKKIAVRLEEKIYSAATSQTDYLRRISIKMLTMESKSQNTIPNSLPPNPSGNTTMPLESGVSLDSTAQIGHSSGGDWREEVHQKIKAMKEMYLPELNEMHQKVVRLLQHDSLPQLFTSEQLENLKITKMVLELLTAYLQISKANMPPGFKLGSFEKQIIWYTSFNKVKKSDLNMQQNNMEGMQHTKYAETSSSSLDSTAETGHSNGDDWQEEIHQKIKAMKEMYLPELNEMHQKVTLTLQQHDSLPQPFTSEQLENLKITKMVLELLTAYLQISKTNISPEFQLGSFEKQIIYYTNFNKVKKSVLNMQQNNMAGMKHTKYAETSSSSLDSTAETGHSNGDDWQEEIHQKIKAMKEMYLPELNEMYQEIASKLQMHDSLPQQPKSELLDNLKMSRALVEHMIALLQVSETNISPSFKEKLGSYEKCIIDYINEYKVRKSIPPQQGQLGQSQMQSHENQINPRIQSMNLPGSVPNMVQNNMIDSTPQTGDSNGSDWQAEGHQKTEQVEKQKLLNNNRTDQSQSQVSPMDSHENQMNSQIKWMSVQGSIPTMHQKDHIEKPEGYVVLQMQSHEKQMKPHIQRVRIRPSVQKIWQTNYVLGICAILLCLAYLRIHHCET